MKVSVANFILLSAGGYSQEYSGYPAPGEDVSWAILPTYTNSAFQVDFINKLLSVMWTETIQIFWNSYLHNKLPSYTSKKCLLDK